MQIFLARIGNISMQYSDLMFIPERVRAIEICNRIVAQQQRSAPSVDASSLPPGVSGTATMRGR